MTHQLEAAIKSITCKFCNGEGTLFSRIIYTKQEEPKVVNTFRECPKCNGSGME